MFDEIVSIEQQEEIEMIDITVDCEDHLFYGNDILIKNSWGLPQTVDVFIALIKTEELSKTGQLLFKQLKNRYRDESLDNKFILGTEKSFMRLIEVNDSTNEKIYQENNYSISDESKSYDFSDITM